MRICDFPFSEVMANTGTTPVLFDCFIPEMDLLIWKMRPCNRVVTGTEFISTAVELFECAIESKMRRPEGAIINELEGYVLFVFPASYREVVLQEMELTELVPMKVAS